MMDNKALITPSVIKWAREKAGYDIAEAAKKIGRPESEIEQWEAGKLYPTISQARTASQVYKRSLAVFYLPEPPLDFDTLRDCRYLPHDQPIQYSPKLLFIIRKIYYRKEWLHEFLESEGTEELKFVNSESIDIEPRKLAIIIRKQLNIQPKDQMKCRNNLKALNLWIDCAEDAGINVCREGGIDVNETRGFIIVDKLSPFIFLNSTDSYSGQLFSLVHELTHLWLGQSGISSFEGSEEDYRRPDNDIEVFCNKVSSEALIDRDTFNNLWKNINNDLDIEDSIDSIARKFSVSNESIARRLLELNVITIEKYRELRQIYKNIWLDYLEISKKKRKVTNSGPNPHLVKAISNGRAFTKTVLSAYNNGLITGSNASDLLDTKINYFPKISSYVGLDA